jgi:hypothetical protein
VTGGEPQRELREELQRLEQQIEQLRRSAAEIRRRIGNDEEGPTDAEEIALLLTEAEQEEAFVEILEARRDHLLQRLRQH